VADKDERRRDVRAGEAAKCPFLISSVLRHSCGYKLANDGQDTQAIQHYLGHRSIASTVRYTRRGRRAPVRGAPMTVQNYQFVEQLFFGRWQPPTHWRVELTSLIRGRSLSETAQAEPRIPKAGFCI
jgi:hypothetical protein